LSTARALLKWQATLKIAMAMRNSAAAIAAKIASKAIRQFRRSRNSRRSTRSSRLAKLSGGNPSGLGVSSGISGLILNE